MDAGKGRVLAIAATAKPAEVDLQLRRGGRFDFEIRMEAPGYEGEWNGVREW